jgi:hypothetical protein
MGYIHNEHHRQFHGVTITKLLLTSKVRTIMSLLIVIRIFSLLFSTLYCTHSILLTCVFHPLQVYPSLRIGCMFMLQFPPVPTLLPTVLSLLYTTFFQDIDVYYCCCYHLTSLQWNCMYKPRCSYALFCFRSFCRKIIELNYEFFENKDTIFLFI